MEYSEKLLAEQVLTLTEICETCGFSSLTYFNKCFSFWHGKTPAQYRKSLPNCTRSYGRAFSETEGTELLLKLNDSYRIINHSAEKLLSTSATLQVDFRQAAGPSFRDLYSPRILLSSYDDLFFLSHYGPELRSLRPAELLVRRDLLRSLPAGENALREPFPVTGGSRALIEPNGLFTSFFHILRILANVSGGVAVRQEHSLVARDGAVLYLLIHKTALRQETSFNVTFKNAPPNVFIMEQRFENNAKFRGILNEFSQSESVPGAILEELNDSFHNKITYTLDPSCQNLSISLLKTGVILLKMIPCP